LLDRRLPYGGSRLKHSTLLLLLKGRWHNAKKPCAKAGRPDRRPVSAGAVWARGCCLVLFLCLPRPAAAQVDETKLPAPAPDPIDFARDIKPILQNSCLRCHGPEKPRSNFHLDNRAAALRGGDNGVDIIPGQSAKSPLIHYVAHLVDGMAMPPIGKGDPLAPAQIALLRAWIDQGAAWEAGPPAGFAFSISPVIGGTSVSGDVQKFREQNWQPGGVNGGLAQFDLA